jgi:hypothetical protein
MIGIENVSKHELLGVKSIQNKICCHTQVWVTNQVKSYIISNIEVHVSKYSTN